MVRHHLHLHPPLLLDGGHRVALLVLIGDQLRLVRVRGMVRVRVRARARGRDRVRVRFRLEREQLRLDHGAGGVAQARGEPAPLADEVRVAIDVLAEL